MCATLWKRSFAINNAGTPINLDTPINSDRSTPINFDTSTPIKSDTR